MDFEITGNVLYHQKFAGKSIWVMIVGERDLVEILSKPNKHLDDEPKSIGRITLKGEQRDLFCRVPIDAVSLVVNMLSQGIYKYIKCNGHLYRGSAIIKSIDFHSDLDPDDWPEEMFNAN